MMADHEALRHLVRGVSAWNEFRRQLRSKPDLTHIEIHHASYSGADFSDTDFDGSTFDRVDFGATNLRCARLNGISASHVSFAGANLRGAELKGADLKHVCLREACLRNVTTFEFRVRHSDLGGADFRGAALRWVHVYNSDLRGAAFAGATFERVVFKRVLFDPAQPAELESAELTVELPNQPNRADWLDWAHFDTTVRDSEFPLIVHAGQAHWISEGRWDVFISHASVDKDAVARPLAQALAARGLRVWYDELEVKLGDDLAHIIDFGTRASLFGVVILSPQFFGRRWTEEEFAALSRKRMFLVLHGVTPQQLYAARPELKERVCARADAGIENIADALLAAMRVPPAAD
jgi:hypothetical protein